jgi:hypothetical protein
MIDTELLIQAIVAKHNATSAIATAFPGGIHIEQAPDNSDTTPYLVIEFASSGIDHAYGSSTTLNPSLILKAVGLQRKATAEALKVWTDVLDAAPTLTGVYSLKRNGGAIPTFIGADEATASTDLWQWAVSYEFSTN